MSGNFSQIEVASRSLIAPYLLLPTGPLMLPQPSGKLGQGAPCPPFSYPEVGVYALLIGGACRYREVFQMKEDPGKISYQTDDTGDQLILDSSRIHRP